MTYTYTVTATQMTLFIILLFWELVWTSLALWKAARHSQPFWFAVMLIVNTAGILPIIYLILSRSRRSTISEHYINTPLVGRG